jgi:Prokaryotic homologs of the JAB domain
MTTTTREVCFLIGADGAVLWSDASNSPFALPDSRARWDAIWSRREQLLEIAHSHPLGPLGFSEEDRTTMIALRSALGKPVRFSVVAPDGVIADEAGVQALVSPEPAWASQLRMSSGMSPG